MTALRTPRVSLPLAVLACLALAAAAESQNKADPYAGHIAPTEARTPQQERRSFRLPPGFEAQLVACEPEIRKPLNIAFDARGRLWVTDTVEYPFPAPAGKGRDGIKILDGLGADGRARKITTFADDLNIPIGVLPLAGAPGEATSALVYSIPNVLRLTDAAGGGKADKKEVLYAAYGFADTHGMTSAFTPGFDGWVYACHGFANTSTIKGADGRPVTMQSGNTYRMRPDGSRLEQHTHGQVNPFGLCFDALGNLYSADCHSQPIYQLLRGAYYPSFGKPHDGLGFGPESITNYQGSTAIAGVVVYAADHFPPAHRGTAYIGDVVTNRINQFRLDWHGSSPKAIQQDFLVSDDPWFRPVDVKLGPDGALYVADFYNRIIGHYEVPLTHPGRDRERGRVWRIVYRGDDGKAPPPAPPRDRTKASVAGLVADLGHANLTVRLQATELLAHRSDRESLEAVRSAARRSEKAAAQAHALWVLERRGAGDDRTLDAALASPDGLVRQHAFRALAERPAITVVQREWAGVALKEADPFVKRAAAEALGRHPDPANLRPLLALRHEAPADDAHLVHAVRIALRDTLRPAEMWKRLPLDPWSEKDARAVADVALGVHGPEAAAYLLDHVRKFPERRGRLAEFVHHAARYGAGETRTNLVAFARSSRPDDLLHQASLAKALEQGTQERGGPLSEDARAWTGELTGKLLGSGKDAEVRAGIELAGSLKMQAQAAALAALAADRAAGEERRTAALVALAGINAKAATALLGRVLTDAAEPFALRERAANGLALLNQPESLAALVAALPTATARLQNAIASGLVGSPAGIDRLLKAIEEGKASPRLLREPAVEPRLSRTSLPGLAERVAKLTKGLPPADQRAQELIAQRRAGFAAAKTDAAQGARLFEKHCAICHQISGKGAKIGPQLDGIGVRGLDRLLEDVLDPNRNVDQAFRLTTLSLKNGQVVSGLLLKEEGEVLVLADAQGKEVRVPRNSVDERSVSQLSPMPANFVEQISEAEFHHLMAYLLRQRPPAK